MKRSDSILLNFYNSKLPKYQQRGLVPMIPRSTGDFSTNMGIPSRSQIEKQYEARKTYEEWVRLQQEKLRQEEARRRQTFVGPADTRVSTQIIKKELADQRARQEAQQRSPLAQTFGSFTPTGSPAAGVIGAETFVNLNPITGPAMSAGRLTQQALGENPYGFDASTFGNILGGVGILGDITGVGSINLLPGSTGVGTSLKSAGKYLTTKTPLRNAHKLNPFAFKPQEGMMYRGLGEEGFQDAIESGVFRPKQHGYAPKRSLAEKVTTPKQFSSTYYAPSEKFDVVKNYGSKYVAEVPFEGNKFGRRYGRKDWSWSTPRQIPIDEGRILKKDWLMGYKPINIPTPTSTTSIIRGPIPNPYSGEYISGRLERNVVGEELPENLKPKLIDIDGNPMNIEDAFIKPVVPRVPTAEELALSQRLKERNQRVIDAFKNKSASNTQISSTSFEKIPPEKWQDMTGFLQRRQFIKQLQQEGLIGKEFSAADLNYAARSTDKTNALTKLALDRYHTGFRNVSGEIPTGGIGRQSYTGREFNMNEPAWGQTISEIDNMKKAGVDLNDPKSIAEYQATYIPLEDYGYRSTGESPTPTYGFLFRSDVPFLNQEYGDYIFKGLPKTDYSVGNYADWYNNFYKNLKYHSSNNSVGPIRKIDLSETMQWGKKPGVTRATLVGPRGTKGYDVDKTFPFQNIKEILSNPELKKSFDEYLNKFMSQYQTGWRGEYKQGGPIVNPRGFMDGEPPKGSNWRIPGDTLYNPTPNKIRAISDNGIEKILNPFDETQVEFQGAQYVDEYKMKMGGLSPNKAREILHDGTVHGRPLTEKQRRFFGAMSKGHTKKYQLGGNALAMLRDYGGGMSVPPLNSPLPKAQLGSLLRSASPIISPMLELTKIFTGDKKETVSEKPKVPEVTLGQYFNIVDPRKIRATTGQPINPNVDLVAGQYPSSYIAQELKLAKQKGLSKEDAWNLAAIAFQESGWGKTDRNLGHVLGPAGKGDYGSTLINAYMNKMAEADRLGITDPYTRLQVYNGLGKIFPSTEQKYHGFKMKKIYGVPVPQGGLNLRDNPLYGKQVIDIRENVLKQNPKLVEYIDSLYKKNGGSFGAFGYVGKGWYKNGGQHGGLDRWFAEKWVDVKTGKPCGRQEGESRAYPACRPSRRVSSKTPKTSGEMSSSEKAKFKNSKTSSQRIPYNHKRR
jgi:hypothetical protein